MPHPNDQRQNNPPAFEPQHKQQSGAKVFIACKHPNGIIIRGMKEIEGSEHGLSGTRTFKFYAPDGRQQIIAGPQVRYGEVPPLTVGGYAFTDHVDKDLYDNWFSANRDGDLIKDEQIHAESSKEGIRDWASKRASVKTGFEGVDPSNPGKTIRGVFKGNRDRAY